MPSAALTMLTQTHHADMLRDGYTVLRKAVPRDVVDNARRAINHSLGQGIDPARIQEFSARSYCPELQEAPALTDLMRRSSVPAAIEAMLGRGCVQAMVRAQIALRFPQSPGAERKSVGGHLDGFGTGTNGITKGQFSRFFTGLAVVLLSELPEPDSGNFTVWPGSHVAWQDFFRKQGVDTAYDTFPKIDLPHEPVQCTGQPGDVVIAHHATFHGAALNYSPNIRYAAIFRIKHRDVEAIGSEALRDIWLEWPGLKRDC